MNKPRTQEQIDAIRERLYAAKRDSGLTVAEIARRSGLARATIERVLGGQFAPSPSSARALSDVFGVPWRQFCVLPDRPRCRTCGKPTAQGTGQCRRCLYSMDREKAAVAALLVAAGEWQRDSDRREKS